MKLDCLSKCNTAICVFGLVLLPGVCLGFLCDFESGVSLVSRSGLGKAGGELSWCHDLGSKVVSFMQLDLGSVSSAVLVEFRGLLGVMMVWCFTLGIVIIWCG